MFEKLAQISLLPIFISQQMNQNKIPSNHHHHHYHHPPSLLKGWIKKSPRSASIRSIYNFNWKKRFFILQDGIMSYYQSELITPPYGDILKGSLNLRYAIVKDSNNYKDISMNELLILPYDNNNNTVDNNKLYLQFENYSMMLEWRDNILQHIDYADHREDGPHQLLHIICLKQFWLLYLNPHIIITIDNFIKKIKEYYSFITNNDNDDITYHVLENKLNIMFKNIDMNNFNFISIFEVIRLTRFLSMHTSFIDVINFLVHGCNRKFLVPFNHISSLLSSPSSINAKDSPTTNYHYHHLYHDSHLIWGSDNNTATTTITSNNYQTNRITKQSLKDILLNHTSSYVNIYGISGVGENNYYLLISKKNT